MLFWFFSGYFKIQNSELLPKSQFRIAKCYEKLLQWDLAAEAYLKVTANYPKSELALFPCIMRLSVLKMEES